MRQGGKIAKMQSISNDTWIKFWTQLFLVALAGVVLISALDSLNQSSLVYQTLKDWPRLIGSLLGFCALLAGALWNFHLTRHRDYLVKHDEVLSVALALYGEILLLREETAFIAKLVAGREIQGSSIPPYVVDHLPPPPALYEALSEKIGLLPAELALAVTQFHRHYQKVRKFLPLLVRSGERIPDAVTAVLKPAWAAVMDFKPALRQIERLNGLDEAADPDLGHAGDVITMEEK